MSPALRRLRSPRMTVTTRRSLFSGALVCLVTSLALAVVLAPGAASDGPSRSNSPSDPPSSTADQARPADYTGVTKCAACHFQQYKDWKSTPHGNAYNILPAKYKQDAECLRCHTTPSPQGQTSVAIAETGQLGVSCESCHGPGEDHAQYALSFVSRNRVFNERELETLRSKIKRLALDQCIRCHVSKAHQPHPKFDREPTSGDERQSSQTPRSRSFFDVHGPAQSKAATSE